MKYECMECKKTFSSREVIISVQQGGFGNIIGWRIECEDCRKQRKKQDAEEEAELNAT